MNKGLFVGLCGLDVVFYEKGKFPAEDTKMTEGESAHYEATEEFVKKFEEAMDDDFNTADALAAIFELVKFVNTNTDANTQRLICRRLRKRSRCSPISAG